jgi:hypothetical protein
MGSFAREFFFRPRRTQTGCRRSLPPVMSIRPDSILQKVCTGRIAGRTEFRQAIDSKRNLAKKIV